MSQVIWTIKHSYGLAVYEISSLSDVAQTGKGNTFFLERTAIKKYDNINTQFKGQATVGDIVPQITSEEVDSSGNIYYVQYVSDLSADGFHVWRYRVSAGDDDDKSNWDNPPTTITTCLSYEIGGEITNPGVTTSTGNSNTTTEDVALDWFEANTGYDVDVSTITNFETVWKTETQGTEFFNSRAMLGVFGIPYQFMPHVDPRLNYEKAGTGAYLTDYSGTGKEWAERIASNMPILFLSPGHPNFMTNFNDSQKNTIFEAMKDFAAGISIGTDDLFSSNGKYYTFEYAVPEYYNYCNPACRIAAAYMGIVDDEQYKIDGLMPDRVNWMDYTTKTLRSLLNNLTDITSYASIPFYIESDTQISESFSNDITDSSLTGVVDEISNIGREAMFVLGYGNAALSANINALSNMEDQQAIRDEIRGMFGSYAEGNGFLANVINHLTSIGTGGRLIFPKIWSDSSFSRSYDVTIKLRSPDMDNFSIFCNIIVPYIHLLCMVLPRQIEDNPNGFYSPFIVRAIYKGFFNVDMGIITSMSVTKGDTGMWNADGIPCSIDVNLTIADLYENISMTPTGGDDLTSIISNFSYDTLDNTCFMDYIANLCGINIYQPEVGRTVKMWLINNVVNRATDLVNVGLWGNIQNSFANAITNVWRK